MRKLKSSKRQRTQFVNARIVIPFVCEEMCLKNVTTMYKAVGFKFRTQMAVAGILGWIETYTGKRTGELVGGCYCIMCEGL